MDEQITDQELAELLADPPENQVNPDINDVPCTVHHARFGAFVVAGVGDWAYTPQGIFATGRWSHETVERDVLIPYEKVEYVEFDFPTLEKYVAAEQAQVPEDGGMPE